jgi:hypothetical protein
MPDCECGFDSESVATASVGRRAIAAASAIALLLEQQPTRSMLHLSPGRWSMIEYAAHVRDVFLTVRDRLVIGLVEENPGFKPLYRDERVALGLYRDDSTAAVATELVSAAAMFVRLFHAIDTPLLSRVVQYGYPDPEPQTLLWMGQQAVHEAEHHRRDIEDNVRLLGSDT